MAKLGFIACLSQGCLNGALKEPNSSTMHLDMRVTLLTSMLTLTFDELRRQTVQILSFANLPGNF